MARDPQDPGTLEMGGVGQLIGYARASKDDQDLSLQLDALKKAGCQQIYSEEVARSGPRRTKKGAHELDAALRALRAGDTLVVWRLDRLAGSVVELIRIVTQELAERRIGFRSLTEHVDTSTAAGNMFFQVCAVFAEYERRLLIERTHAGLAAARARGRKGGRPHALDEAKQHEVRVLMNDPSVRAADVMRRYGIGRTTLYKYVRDGKLKTRTE